MKTYQGPNGTRFEYSRELEGNVFIDGTPVEGADLLAFFKHLMDECVDEAVAETENAE